MFHILLFISHYLHSLFIFLFIRHYLNVPFLFFSHPHIYFFLFFCLLVIYRPYLFLCLSVIICTFLFNLLFIGHYLHVPCAKVKNPRCYQEPVFATMANVSHHCQKPQGFQIRPYVRDKKKKILPCLSTPALNSVSNLRKYEV
jgi:hypothetical protein